MQHQLFTKVTEAPDTNSVQAKRVSRPTPLAQVRRRPAIARTLCQSAISHMRTAIEFFNRPQQAHRHEIAAELAVTAWEKLLKAYLYKKAKHPLFFKDGRTRDFETCCNVTRDHLHANSPPIFADTYENLLIIYQYRNDSIHFYAQGMDAILHGIFAECVEKFARFLKVHFRLELLPPNDVGVLPIGFKRPVTVKDFLSDYSASESATTEVKQFLKKLHDAGERLETLGVAPEHSVLLTFRIALEDAKKLKHADTVVGVDNSNKRRPTLSVRREVYIDETELRKRYPHRDKEIRDFAMNNGIKLNQAFNDYMRIIKSDTEVCQARLLYFDNPKSQIAYYFSDKAFEKLSLKFLTE